MRCPWILISSGRPAEKGGNQLAAAAAPQLVYPLDEFFAMGGRGQGKADSLAQDGVPKEVDVVQLNGHGCQGFGVHGGIVEIGHLRRRLEADRLL